MISKLRDMYKNFNHSKNLILSVLATGLVLALLVFQTISISELKAKIVDEEKSIQSDRKRLDHLRDLKKNLSLHQEKLLRLEAAIPSSLLEESILVSLQHTAEASTNQLFKITFSKPIATEAFSQIPLTISYTGNYYSLLDLFYHLHNSPRALKVESFSISKEKNKATDLKAEIRAFAFYTATAKAKTTKK